MSAILERPDWIVRGLSLVGLVWCLVVLGYDWGPAISQCREDTSYCAKTREKNGLYLGVLRDPQGRPQPNTTFFVEFASRRQARPRSVRFTSDARGRFCIVWADERVNPFIRVGDRLSVDSTEPWQPLNGAKPPPDCQRGAHGIPRDRASNTTDKRRHQPNRALGLIGALIFIFALAAGAAQPAPILLCAALAMTLANTFIAAFR